MRRKPKNRPDEPKPTVATDETGETGTSGESGETGQPGTDAASSIHHDEFWSAAPAGVDEHLETLAAVIETDEGAVADDTLEYMGSIPSTHADGAELVKLAEWAESKACRVCRKKMQETHDPAALKHDDCRSALRVERLLRRYD